jgi:phospholipid/cholesterol/gamma-HCH transport system permease protein
VSEEKQLNWNWEGEKLHLIPQGKWTYLDTFQILPYTKKILKEKKPTHIILDFQDITTFDSIGGAELKLLISSFKLDATNITFQNMPQSHTWFLDQLKEPTVHGVSISKHYQFRETVETVGENFVDVCKEFHSVMSFSGLFYMKAIKLFFSPKLFRSKAFVNQIKWIGIDALPIVMLLIFLIGIVLAYQGVTQFRKFGAEIFVVNLLGVSILREIGVLITAIIIAGRSGSAITAQLGSMKINREVDALQVMGLDPIYVLVLPRILALTVTLPVLTFIADLVGLFGGAVMCRFYLDLSFVQFLEQLKTAVDLKTFIVGFAKAPFFGFIIALIATYQGFQVFESAQSLGRMTTRSVVQSIFSIIVLDAIFSILFAMYQI